MDIPAMEIDRAKETDIDTLVDISRKIFYESFHHQNTPENMQEYMDRAFTPAQMGKEIRNPESEFYFSVLDNRKVGFIKINRGPAQSDIRDNRSLEVERLYVDAAFQGKRIGAQLMDKAKARARELGLDYVWLGVWEKNISGIRFYTREGFYAFGNHAFRMGDDLQTDVLMRFDLQ